MIHELIIDKPTATPLPWWPNVKALKKRKKFKFKPGFNIIVGDNGSGKTTLLKALATLTHCAQGGRPKVTTESLDDFRPRGAKGKYPDGMRLVTDGQPVHFLDPSATPGMAHGQFDWSVMSGGADMGLALGLKRLSSGQSTNALLNRIAESVGESGETLEIPSSYRAFHGHDVALGDRHEVALRGLQRTEGIELGPKTVLLDEPSRSLDIRNQVTLWMLLQRWCEDKDLQLIIATHSPFAWALKDPHVIELVKGYYKLTKTALEVFLGPITEYDKKEDGDAEGTA